MLRVVAFLLLLPVQAMAAADCDWLLRAPVLRRTQQPTYEIEAFYSSGLLLPPGFQIPKLKNGRYLYLITNRDEVLLGRKYQLDKWPRALVTHKALLRMYNERT